MVSPDTGRAGRRRGDVLHQLRESPRPLSIVGLAEALGVHANTVRFHLDKLVASGQVERHHAPSTGPGRPPALFAATRGMDPGGPRQYQLLAEALVASLADAPDAKQRAVEAGRRLGAKAATVDRTQAPAEPVDGLVDLLDHLGFEPELRNGEDLPTIGLRHCPFLELAHLSSEVVCPIHLGLMRGAVEAWGAAISVDRLDAFVEPDLCVTHLSRTGAQ